MHPNQVERMGFELKPATNAEDVNNESTDHDLSSSRQFEISAKKELQ
jgi:hypothetical protein